MLNTGVENARKEGKKVFLSCLNNISNTKEDLAFDKVLVSVGRKTYHEGLGLEKLGVKINKNNTIAVDNNFQTSIPNIFAIGDVIEGPMLAHKAEEEGIAVAEFIAGQSGHVNYEIIPGVIYTTPEVASVGKTEEQLNEKKINFKVGKFPFMAN